jgi:hypothetical protein
MMGYDRNIVTHFLLNIFRISAEGGELYPGMLRMSGVIRVISRHALHAGSYKSYPPEAES